MMGFLVFSLVFSLLVLLDLLVFVVCEVFCFLQPFQIVQLVGYFDEKLK